MADINKESPLVSNEQNEKWLEAVNKDLDGRSHPMPEDEKNAYAMAYVQARNEGKTHQEALAEGRKGQKKRQEERKREEEERMKREEEEARRREEEKAMREAHAANEEALGMSFDASGAMESFGPTVNEVGANDTDISEESESQMNRGEIDIVLLFSLLSAHDLKSTRVALEDDGLTENLSMVCALRWEDGAPVNYAEKKFFTIDCSHLHYDSVLGTTITPGEMMGCLEGAMGLVYQYLEEAIKPYEGGEVHLSVASFFAIEELLYAFAAISGKDLPNSELYDDFTNVVKKYFNFTDFENNGWKFIVDYACLYEANTLYCERRIWAGEIKMLMNIVELDCGYSVKNEYIPPEIVENVLDPMVVPYGNARYSYRDLREYLPIRTKEERLWAEYKKAAEHSAAVERGEGEYWFPKSPSEVAHTVLGLTSVILSPLSLVDAGLHVYEWISGGDENNAHKKGIAIDIVCCIPFVRIFKVIKGGNTISRLGHAASATGKAALKGLEKGVLNNAQLLYYKGKRILLKAPKRLRSHLADRAVAKGTKDVAKRKGIQEGIQNGAADYEGAKSRLSELYDLQTGMRLAEDEVGQLEKALTSGKLTEEAYWAKFRQLIRVRDRFDKQKKAFDALKGREEALKKTVNEYEKLVAQGEKVNENIARELEQVWNNSGKYKEWVDLEKKISQQITAIYRANQSITERVLGPWVKVFGAPAGECFKEWAKPVFMTFKDTLKTVKNGKGYERALAVESLTQTIGGAIAAGVGTYSLFNKSPDYGALAGITNFDDKIVEIVLDDGTVEWSSDTILELTAAIEQMRGAYGYKDEDDYRRSQDYSISSTRYKTNSPLDIYK